MIYKKKIKINKRSAILSDDECNNTNASDNYTTFAHLIHSNKKTIAHKVHHNSDLYLVGVDKICEVFH